MHVGLINQRLFIAANLADHPTEIIKNSSELMSKYFVCIPVTTEHAFHSFVMNYYQVKKKSIDFLFKFWLFLHF